MDQSVVSAARRADVFLALAAIESGHSELPPQALQLPLPPHAARIAALLCMGAAVLLLSGCGTITQTSTQLITVHALDARDRPVAGLKCKASNLMGEQSFNSPSAQISVRRSASDLEIECREASGNEVAKGTVQPRRDWLEQALVPFGSVAVAVDHLTGHLYAYPTVVRLQLGKHLRFQHSEESRPTAVLATLGDTLVADVAAAPPATAPLPPAAATPANKPASKSAGKPAAVPARPSGQTTRAGALPAAPATATTATRPATGTTARAPGTVVTGAAVSGPSASGPPATGASAAGKPAAANGAPRPPVPASSAAVTATTAASGSSTARPAATASANAPTTAPTTASATAQTAATSASRSSSTAAPRATPAVAGPAAGSTAPR